MMTSRTWIAPLSAAVAGCVLTACGGGGGGGRTAGIDGTGATNQNPMTASAISVGTVTGFGSIFVNGVRFDTSSATFEIDGAPGTQDQLDVGDVVIVVGTLDSGSTTDGTATSVMFDDIVEGPIEAASIDPAAGTFVVLGQSVRVAATTSFDNSIQPASIDGLAGGQIVEVTGFIASDGSVEATRIEPKPASTELEVTGRVTNLDDVNLTFTINALEVDYSMATPQDFPGRPIEDGDLVEVKGATTLGANGQLVAARVEYKGADIDGNDGDHVEIEGFITRFVDETDFDVSGVRVTTTSQTAYDGGMAGDLGLDIKVEVEGELDANGVLVADDVDIRRASAVRAGAVIDSVDAANGSFVLLGITVHVDELTRIEDKRDDVEPFSIANLAAGDYVEVRGSESPAGSGEILATLVERDDFDPANDDTELRGFVQAASDPTVTILGVTAAAGPGATFEQENGGSISRATFFNQVAQDDLVEVRGLEVGDRAIDADELQFENP